MCCAILYHLYNLKNVNNTQGRLKPVTLLQITPLHGCFSRFLNCTNGTESCKAPQMSPSQMFVGVLITTFPVTLGHGLSVCNKKNQKIKGFSISVQYLINIKELGKLKLLILLASLMHHSYYKKCNANSCFIWSVAPSIFYP